MIFNNIELTQTSVTQVCVTQVCVIPEKLYLCNEFSNTGTMKSSQKELQKPFVFGQAIGDNHFIGREREQQRLAANFAHGINTILMAPRRWGKTSLVKRTMAEIQSEPFRNNRLR